ncbi:MAG: monovalent cation/H+ antiporter subunit D family protein [Planctomycetes bacterium]|nr:monovalent cation/H+ antiporter subunit D family protein [Planctomycetota bacterium]
MIPDQLQHQIPALIVLTPLVLGLITALIGRRGLGWWIAMLASLLVFAGSIQLLIDVMHSGTYTVSYLMGNWPVPYGIEYRIDPLNGGVLCTVALISAAVTLFARRSVASEVSRDRLHFFYAVWLFCQTGLLGITITGDAFNLYVLLEISSLATYTLVAMGKGRDRRALTAAINYLVLGTIGASFILLGIGFLYMVTGTLNMMDMAERLDAIYITWGTAEPQYQKTVLTGFAFLFVGVSLKLALFPLHTWLPNAYTYAPAAVSALLAATATKVGAYISIRFIYTIVGTDAAFRGAIPTHVFIMVSAGMAILLGSYLAIKQDNVKKILAYSSIAQIGYIALGFALDNKNGLTAAVIHIFNHALTKGGMFMALGVVAYRLGNTRLQDLRGLGRKLPVSMGAFTAGGLGLIGVPLTAGFVSKWYLVTGAIEAGRYEMAAIVLVGSLLAVVYVWRVVETIYFGKRDEGAPNVQEAPITMLVPMLLLIGASIYFGVDANTTSWIAEAAAETLLGVQP